MEAQFAAPAGDVEHAPNVSAPHVAKRGQNPLDKDACTLLPPRLAASVRVAAAGKLVAVVGCCFVFTLITGFAVTIVGGRAEGLLSLLELARVLATSRGTAEAHREQRVRHVMECGNTLSVCARLQISRREFGQGGRNRRSQRSSSSAMPPPGGCCSGRSAGSSERASSGRHPAKKTTRPR